MVKNGIFNLLKLGRITFMQNWSDSKIGVIAKLFDFNQHTQYSKFDENAINIFFQSFKLCICFFVKSFR